MSNGEVNVARRRFLTAATSVVGAAGVVGAAVPFVGSWNPSAKAKAAGAPVKADISKLEPGQIMTVEWRGKPVYIVRRTKQQLDSLASLNERLRDPNSERKSQQPEYIKGNERSIKPEYLIVVGLCTHLGCAPAYRMTEVFPAQVDASVGGFYCPCHGSYYDLAGRVFQGVPAPANLEVPKHFYETDAIVVIGEDGGVA